MKDYCYHTVLIHDHLCDVCLYRYIIECTKDDCSSKLDEMCYECFQEYKRFMEKFK